MRIATIIFLLLILCTGCADRDESGFPLDETLFLLDHPQNFVSALSAPGNTFGYGGRMGDYRRSILAGNLQKFEFSVSSPPSGSIRFSYSPGDDADSYAGDITIRLRIRKEEEEKLVGKWEMQRGMLKDSGWQDASVRWPEEFTGKVSVVFEIEGLLEEAPASAFYIGNPRIVPDLEPNSTKRIILIGVTALRADHLGCYGYYRDTSPNIDALAAKAVLFDYCYSNSSLTRDSVDAIFEFSEVGNQFGNYSSICFQNNFPLIEDTNYVPAFNESRMMTLTTSRKVLESAKNWLASHVDEDCITFIHLAETGLPYVAPLEFRERYDPEYDGDFKYFYTENLYEWGGEADYPEDVREHLIALYDEEIAATDASIGWFMESLEQEGLLEKSVVMLFGLTGEGLWDHGTLGHGNQLYIEQLHVPFLIIDSDLGNQMEHRKIVSLDGIGQMLRSLIYSEDFHPYDFFTNKGPSNSYALSANISADEVSYIKDNYHLIWDWDRDVSQLFNLQDDPRELNDIADTSPELEPLLDEMQKAIDRD